MSFADHIRQAPSPQAAMLVLAEGIDAVLARLDAGAVEPVDPWGAEHWSEAPRVEAGSANVSLLEAALAKETDPENRLAMEARLRLLKEDGAAVDLAPSAGRLVDVQESGDEVLITLPTPSPERQATWRAFAERNALHTFTSLGPEEFVAAFSQGGPLWLYHSNREAVMTMPYNWRQIFVEDINQDSPRTAQEVGRDILKSEEADGNMAATLNNLADG